MKKVLVLILIFAGANSMAQSTPDDLVETYQARRHAVNVREAEEQKAAEDAAIQDRIARMRELRAQQQERLTLKARQSVETNFGKTPVETRFVESESRSNAGTVYVRNTDNTVCAIVVVAEFDESADRIYDNVAKDKICL